jgi:NADPH-dependent ferric siderophore reductase
VNAVIDDEPRITRVRHELKRRALTVERVERIAPRMVRVVLKGEQLQGFTSLGFDDHIKVFFPDGAGGVAMRDFTPRRYDAVRGELWVDFYLHESGPAASWALQAAAGQSLEIGGPKGSAVIASEGIGAHVLIGDETALPAIGRRLEELRGSTRARVVVEVDDVAAWRAFALLGNAEVVWVGRGGVIDALRQLRFPEGGCFFWVAMESQSTRAVRRYLCDERGVGKRWVKAAGYWQKAASGTHEVITDED